MIWSAAPAASDADGDSLLYTYNWFDPNGSNASSAGPTSNSSDTLAAASVSAAGDWTCQVSASDGSASSGTALQPSLFPVVAATAAPLAMLTARCWAMGTWNNLIANYLSDPLGRYSLTNPFYI